MDDSSVVMNPEPIINFDMEWNSEHEQILIDWADKAMCYRWLHSNANNIYTRLNMWYTIPVIIISTITGTANFAQDRIPPEYLSYYVMIVGAFNIFAGIISTIQQFLKISDLKESHRVSSIAWDKFYRNIKIELSKKPNERIPVAQMLKIYKEEYDRLMETSPDISKEIIQKFNDTFNSTPNFKELRKPEICDSLVSTSQFLYVEKDKGKAKPYVDVIKQQVKKHKKIIKDFITEFEEVHSRKPLQEEILESLSNKIPLEKLSFYVQNLNTETETEKTTDDSVSIDMN